MDRDRLSLYQQGFNDGEIGKMLGYHGQTIYAWRKKNGLPTKWRKIKKAAKATKNQTE